MKYVKITKGLDLRMTGTPDQTSAPEKKSVKRVAVTGPDYVGMKPTILVEVGEKVLLGQPLFEDKKNPGVKFVAPAAGVVASINRGEKRAFRSIIIDVAAGDAAQESVAFEKFDANSLTELCPTKVRETLVKSGLWTALRTRPFSRIPKIDAIPAALFVNVCDTNPHAPNPQPIVEAASEDFVNGLRVLSRICGKKLWVCFGDAKYSADFIAAVEAVPNVEAVSFSGPHPSGLTGTHIATLDPCGLGKVVWSIGYQDAIAVGALFVKGTLPTERVVSLAGPTVKNPRLLRVPVGACLDEIVDGELKDGPNRVISGSVLCGRAAEGDLCGLGRYVNQISAIGDGDPREFFGWALPGFKKFSAARTVASKWLAKTPFAPTTAEHGGKRAVFPNPTFYKVSPLDLEPTFLFKALEIGDLEKCEKLGAFELDEEDLALFTLVDFGKNDYGQTLRALLNAAMKEEE